MVVVISRLDLFAPERTTHQLRVRVGEEDDYEALFHVPARIENITADQLRETASAIFDDDNMTVGTLLAPPEEEQ